ncbi:hypothetical protein ACWDBP_47955 [Streptomyces sp. NPDC001233]
MPAARHRPGRVPGIDRVRLAAPAAAVGRADRVRDTGGERLFRYRPGPGPGPDHGNYLLCTECGLSRPVDSGPVED